MSLESITEAIRAKVGDNSGLDATVKFVIDEGVVFVDGKSSPNAVTNDDDDADCTVTMSAENLEELLSGELDPTMAFMTGKLKVDGNMAVAMSLQKIL